MKTDAQTGWLHPVKNWRCRWCQAVTAPVACRRQWRCGECGMLNLATVRPPPLPPVVPASAPGRGE